MQIKGCVSFLDNTDAGLLLVLLLLLLFANAFFSLIETALTESHRGRLEKLAEDGNRDAEAALGLLENAEAPLSLVQVGITLTGILMGICTGAFIAPYLATFISFLPHATLIAMILSIVVVTYIALLFSEFLPKKKAAQNPERILMKYHRIVARLTHLARPFIRFLSSSASGVLLLLGINPNIEDTVTEDEVKDLIEQGTEDGTFEKSEQAMVDRTRTAVLF